MNKDESWCNQMETSNQSGEGDPKAPAWEGQRTGLMQLRDLAFKADVQLAIFADASILGIPLLPPALVSSLRYICERGRADRMKAGAL